MLWLRTSCSRSLPPSAPSSYTSSEQSPSFVLPSFPILGKENKVGGNGRDKKETIHLPNRPSVSRTASHSHSQQIGWTDCAIKLNLLSNLFSSSLLPAISNSSTPSAMMPSLRDLRTRPGGRGPFNAPRIKRITSRCYLACSQF